MMAVIVPSGGRNILDTKLKVDNEVVSIFGSEDRLQIISKENMDQIRNTMMRHEALFKEQVQALHKLYNIQKSAMQEINKRIYSQAQVLAFNSRTIAVGDGQLLGSVGEGKPLRPAYNTAQAHGEESHALSLHHTWALKGLTGSDSLWMNNTKVKTFPIAQNKPVREIDLERLPEDYLDDSEIQFEANSSEIPAANTSLSERIPHTDEVSFVSSNWSVLQVDSPSLKQRDPKTDIERSLVACQENHQFFDQTSERKVHGVDVKKCDTGFQRLHNTFQSNTLQNFHWHRLPAGGNSHVYEEPNRSSNQHVEKPLWLHQGSLVFTTQSLNSNSNPTESKELHLQGTPEQAKGSILPGSTHLGVATTPHLKLDDQIVNSSNDRDSSTNPVICIQGSSMLESVQCDSKNLNGVKGSPSLEMNSVSGKQNMYCWAMTSQTSTSVDGGNENPNCSGQGSNSIQSQGAKVYKDCNASNHTKEDPTLATDFCEPGQMSHGLGERVQSELEEVPRFTNNGIKPSLSSTLPDSEVKNLNHSKCSSDCPETVASQEDPVVVTESNEDPKTESTLEEACESIAAKILLSFAPSGSWGNAKLQDFNPQIEAESSTSRDSMGCNKKRILRPRRGMNYSNGGVVNDTLKWTKTVHGRRRTSRRS
ncbi:hypothetical protein HHK36_013836 [Tetracentron sinense]|uniref:Uncharacterized protein n=1 Tax=Tetracentron sinense TaxID=13715 RepID=A0A834ZE16_TETSI|nr:hypothetical protein HHK36_013836 [Tetracentron sinense]